MKLTLVLLLVDCACVAQSQTPDLRFDVVSIKPNRSGGASVGNRFDPARMAWTNVTLKGLIEAAYHIKDFQLGARPAWVDTEAWDIEAVSEKPTTSAQKYEMLRVALEDRFQLKAKLESRELPVLRLIVDSHGARLKTADVTLCKEGAIKYQRGLIVACRASMPNFIYFLSTHLDIPVLDGTYLPGEYSFELRWDSDNNPSSPDDAASPPGPSGPSLFTAVQEQLGLKLKREKGPVDFLVIEHVSRPAAN